MHKYTFVPVIHLYACQRVDQRVDLWVGDPACMHNEPNTLFISVKELVSRVIRNVDTFITAEIARIKSWTQRKQSKRMQR